MSYGFLYRILVQHHPTTILLHRHPFAAKIAIDLYLSPQESGLEGSAVSELQKRLEMSVSLSCPEFQITEEMEDKDFLELASQLIEETVAGTEQISHNQVNLVYFTTSPSQG